MPRHKENDSKIEVCGSILSSVRPGDDDDWTREYDIGLAVTDTQQRQHRCLVWLHRILLFLDGGVGSLWTAISIVVGLHAEQAEQQHSHSHVRWVVFGLTAAYAVFYGIRCAAGILLRKRCLEWVHNCCTIALITQHLVITVGVAVLAAWDADALERSIAQEFKGFRHSRKIWACFAVCLALEMVRWMIGKLVLYPSGRDSENRVQDSLQEPLLWRWLEFETDSENDETRQREWADRSAQDPLWWSREEEDKEPENSSMPASWLAGGEV